jgi:hypothetical protein
VPASKLANCNPSTPNPSITTGKFPEPLTYQEQSHQKAQPRRKKISVHKKKTGMGIFCGAAEVA